MKTPKKKALSRLMAYEDILQDHLPNDIKNEIIKKCVNLEIDEIKDAIDWHDFETPNKLIEYWEEVKKELNKM